MDYFQIFYGFLLMLILTELSSGEKGYTLSPEFTVRMMGFREDDSIRELVFAEESFDLEGNRVALLHNEPGEQVQLVRNYAKGTLLEIRKNFECDFIMIKDVDELGSLILGETGTRFSIGKILNKAKDKAVQAEGNYEVNGIATDRWTANLEIKGPIKATNYSLQVDFAVSNWSFPIYSKADSDSWNQPQRLVISGVEVTDNNETNFKSTHIFTNYVNQLNDKIFQIPMGFYCPDMKQIVKAVPILSGSFSVGIETYIYTSHGILKLQMEVAYDQPSQMIRTDLRTIVSTVANVQRDIGTVIEDKITNKMYVIDSTTGECLHVLPSPEVLNATESLKRILFGSENMTNAHYIGERPCRIGRCDVYATMEGSTVFNIDIRHEKGSKYFYPLSVRKWNKNEMSQKMELSSVEEYFNFDFNQPDWTLFDFFSCIRNPNDSLRIQVTLKGEYLLIRSKLEQFKRAFVESVHTLTGITRSRINRMKIDYKFIRVIVTATLTSEPVNTIKAGKSNREVYNDLASAMWNGTFMIMFGKSLFIGIDITDQVLSGDESDQNIAALKKYKSVKNRDLELLPEVHSVRETTLDNCVAMCDNDAATNCETFSFCRSNGYCRMVDLRLEFIPGNNLTENTDCTLYGRNYASDFKLYEGVAIPKQGSDDSISNVKKIDECFAECEFRSGKGNGTCQSFEKCGSMCTFHAYHILEISEDKIIHNPECQHYSRNYADLFITMSKKTFTSDEWIRIDREADLDTCAFYCFTDPQGCTDFEMSSWSVENEVKFQCTLMTVKENIVNPSFNMSYSSTIDHYRLRDPKPSFPGTPTVLPTSEFSDETTYIGYSRGEMVALGFCMAILGIILGALIVYIVARYRAMSGDDDDIVLQIIGRE